MSGPAVCALLGPPPRDAWTGQGSRKWLRRSWLPRSFTADGRIDPLAFPSLPGRGFPRGKRASQECLLHYVQGFGLRSIRKRLDLDSFARPTMPGMHSMLVPIQHVTD